MDTIVFVVPIICCLREKVGKNQVRPPQKIHIRFGRAFGKSELRIKYDILYGVLQEIRCPLNEIWKLGIYLLKRRVSCVEILKSHSCIAFGCVSMPNQCGSLSSVSSNIIEKVLECFLFYWRRCCVKGQDFMWLGFLQLCGACGKGEITWERINLFGHFMRLEHEQKIWWLNFWMQQNRMSGRELEVHQLAGFLLRIRSIKQTLMWLYLKIWVLQLWEWWLEIFMTTL